MTVRASWASALATVGTAALALFMLGGCSSSGTAATRPSPSYSLPALPPRPAFDANARAAAPGGASGGGDHLASYSFSDDSTSAAQTVQIEGSSTVRKTGNVATRAVNDVAKLAGGAFGGSNAPRASAQSARVTALPAGEAAKDEEKIEREAQLAIEVKDVNEAAARVLALVRTHEGSVTKDQRNSGAQSQNAEILVRVPSAHFDAFTSELGSVGEIRSRNIRAVDVSIEHKDLGILVANLEAALARYRELLQKATDPMQVLAVERELERVRSDLDRVKGRLAFVTDRVARSTVAIALHSPEPPPDVPTGHRPSIAPGVRALTFVDVRESGTNGYVGTGLSLRLPRTTGDSGRGLILDVDVMRACCKARPERSEWAYDVLTGIDLYSESLQSGRRRFLNPYLGLRVGISQTQNRADFAAAGVFGLELLKTAALMIDLQARVMAMVGNPDGPHAAVQPSFGFDLGF